jgi:calpain-7
VDQAPTKDQALKGAILATELYMKAVKHARDDQEKSRLRGKCKELLSRAEEIKKSKEWPPQKNPGIALKVPSSERSISRSEEIILLEGSKLHGFIFPPWTVDPDDSLFVGEIYMYSLLPVTC